MHTEEAVCIKSQVLSGVSKIIDYHGDRGNTQDKNREMGKTLVFSLVAFQAVVRIV